MGPFFNPDSPADASTMVGNLVKKKDLEEKKKVRVSDILLPLIYF